jgi:transcription elongation factor GreB
VGDDRQPGGHAGVKTHITPRGLQPLRDELRFLLAEERPAVTQVVAWAASNGDRSDNADYQYNKRRLRQIDRRIRFLTKRTRAAATGDRSGVNGPRRSPRSMNPLFQALVAFDVRPRERSDQPGPVRFIQRRSVGDAAGLPDAGVNA